MRYALTVLSGLCAVGGTPAWAQTTDRHSDAPATTPADATQDNGSVDDIIVTAQRRSETLTSVPASISATSGEDLAASGIRDLASLATITPGYTAANGVGYTQVFIRGVGNSIYVGADPSVATFIDDTPRIYGSLVNSFINVSRIEVLKGAQGGLYGRNATGGVVNIITRQPDNTLAMQARLSAASHNTVDASGFVNLPLGRSAAMTLALTRQYHDPYIKNVSPDAPPYPAGTRIVSPYTGQDYGDANAGYRKGRINDQDFWAVDGKLRVDLTPNLVLTLGADYASKKDGNGATLIQKAPSIPYATYAFLATLNGVTFTPPGYLRCPDGTSTSCLQPPFATPGKFTGYSPFQAYANITDYGGSARAALSLGGVDLTSITSFRWNKTGFFNDTGGASYGIVSYMVDNDKRNFYQEVRAITTNDGPLHVIGGATYLNDHFKGRTVVYLLGVSDNPPTLPTISTQGWSVYGQAGYDLTSRLTLTGSLRYVRERKRIDFLEPFTAKVSGTQVSQGKLLPSATLSYAIDGGTLYARYAKGFKTGGINPVVPPSAFLPSTIGSIFKPEQVNTYEIGYRALLFDRKVQLTTAAFYNDYRDIQVNAAGAPGRPDIPAAVLNASKARTYGAEAAVTWRVAAPLTVSANVGYLNARYTDFVIPPGGTFAPVNNNGRQMIYAPEWQGGASVDLDQPIANGLRFVAHAVYSRTTRIYFDPTNIIPASQAPYSLINGRVGLVTRDDRVGAYVFVNNLLNQFYTTFGPYSPSVGATVAPGDPRIVGGTLELKF